MWGVLAPSIVGYVRAYCTERYLSIDSRTGAIGRACGDIARHTVDPSYQKQLLAPCHPSPGRTLDSSDIPWRKRDSASRGCERHTWSRTLVINTRDSALTDTAVPPTCDVDRTLRPIQNLEKRQWSEGSGHGARGTAVVYTL